MLTKHHDKPFIMLSDLHLQMLNDADEMSDDQKPVKPAVKQIGTYHQPRATFARLGGSFVLYL